MAVTKKNAARVLFREDGSREKRNSGTDYVWDPSQQSAGEVAGTHWADPETPGLWDPTHWADPETPGLGDPPQWHQPAQGSEEPTQSNRQDSTDKTKESDLLEKILGGPDPYGAKQSGFGLPQVPDAEESTPEAENEPDEQSGTGVPDVEVNGYIEALRGILDPDYAARASEDVMGQYAAMTGGRPSSAAISAGTAARADAEATLLRELLSGRDTQNGESGGLLSGLLGENATTGETDVPEEYADYADLPGYDTIVPMLESFESEEDMGDYLADMVNKGLISEAVATEYLKRFDDPYEEYDAEGRIDYSSMVKNPGGWTLTDDGGTNFFGGLNRNMKIKSPNGQEFTVAQLYRLLKKNGMDAKEAETYLVKLQNYLKSKE